MTKTNITYFIMYSAMQCNAIHDADCNTIHVCCQVIFNLSLFQPNIYIIKGIFF